MAAPPASSSLGASQPVVGAPRRRLLADLPQWLDRHRVWLWLMLALLYALAFNGQWRLGPDTAIYMEVGRNLAQGQGFVHPTGLQAMANPGLPHLIAGAMRLLGDHAIMGLLLVMQLCLATILILNYVLLRLHTSRPHAVAGTFLLGISAIVFRSSLEILTDVPFMVGVMLLLVGWELWVRRGKATRWAIMAWGLIVLGLTLMAAMRIVVLVPAAALLLTLLIDAIRQKRYKLLALATAVAVAPLLLRALDPRTGSGGLLLKERQILQRFIDLPQTLTHAWEHNIPMLVDSTANMIAGQNVFESLRLPEIILCIASFAFALALGRKRLLWGVLVALFLVQWVLFLPDVRYTLPIVPLVLYGWWRASRWILLVIWRHRAGATIAGAMIAFVVLMNLIRVGSVIVEQRSTPFLDHYQSGRYQHVPQLASTINKLLPHDAWLIADNSLAAPLTHMSKRPCASQWDDAFSRIPLTVPLYIVLPLDEPTAGSLAQHGASWQRLSPPLVSLERTGDRPPLELYRLLREETP